MFPSTTRILIVDDMKSLRTMLADLLRGMGYVSIAEAQDGQDAWDLMMSASQKLQPFELIISDWNMPVMSGLDLLKKIRSFPSWRYLPFIMLTTESEKGKVIEALSCGVSNYLVKPLDADALKDRLQKVHAKTNTN